MEHKVTKKDFFKKKLGTADASAKKVQEVKKIKPEPVKEELKKTIFVENKQLEKKEITKEKTQVKKVKATQEEKTEKVVEKIKEDKAQNEKIQVKETKESLKKIISNPPKREKIPGKIFYVIQEAGELFIKNDMNTLALGMEQILKEEQKDFFAVAVVGEFSRGKSTFVNHLLGKEILPVSSLPTTAMMTRVRYRKEEKIAVYNDKGQRVKVMPLSDESWDGLTVDHLYGREVKGVAMVGVKNTWIRDNCLEIIDTPGAGDLEESRAKIIGETLLGSDGAIITISATSPLSESEQLFIEQRLIAKKVPFLMIIVTKLDLIPLKERSNVLSYIKKRMSLTKAGNIPVFVPYAVEMPDHIHDDMIGMDKVKEEVLSWMYHPERSNLTAQWITGRVDSILETAKESLNEQLVFLEADEEKRTQIIQAKKNVIQQAENVWEDLKLEMRGRYLECYRLFGDKLNEYTSSMIERLQFECKRSNNPQKWWQEDYSYRVKVELTNMAVGLENAVSRKIMEDMNWFSRVLHDNFKKRILSERQTIVERDTFRDSVSVNEDMQLDNLTKKRELSRIGTTTVSILGAISLQLAGLGMFSLVATSGVSTGASLVSERFFRGKIEEQQQRIQEKIAQTIPQIILESTEQSERRLQAVYEEIIDEASKEQKIWLQAQNDALENSLKGEGMQKKEEVISLMEQITELQYKLH